MEVAMANSDSSEDKERLIAEMSKLDSVIAENEVK